MEKYDAIIIGFGKGGKTLVAKLAAGGKKVAIIEKSNKMYGGTCINVGCIPSKSLVNSSHISLQNSTASFEEKSNLYAEAINEKRKLTSMLRKKNFDKLNNSNFVTVYNGTASFLSNIQVNIQIENENIVIEGEKIFINTGSYSFIPNIQGIENNPYVYTSESLMDLEKLPKRLVIVGGGYIGLEFASMYSDFGCEVTILQDGTTFIPREDADIAAEIKNVLEQKGVKIKLGALIKSITKNENSARVSFDYDGENIEIDAQAVLIATGRRPNIKDLNLDKAGVEVTQRGAVKVNDKLQTSVANIWAMGDVAGGLQFTYVSLDDYRNVWSQLNEDFEYNAENRKNVPYSVFINPSFSRVGINETEAVKEGYNIKVVKMPASAIPKAQVLKKTNGLLKAIIDLDTNKILGVMLFCEESYEMINIVKLAMDMGADYKVLRDQIFTHPTMSEALNDLFSL